VALEDAVLTMHAFLKDHDVPTDLTVKEQLRYLTHKVAEVDDETIARLQDECNNARSERDQLSAVVAGLQARHNGALTDLALLRIAERISRETIERLTEERDQAAEGFEVIKSQIRAGGTVTAMLKELTAERDRLVIEKDRFIRIMGDAWSALRMVRECIEQQSVGALPSEEAVLGIGPTLLHEATVLVEGVLALTAERDAAIELLRAEMGYARESAMKEIDALTAERDRLRVDLDAGLKAAHDRGFEVHMKLAAERDAALAESAMNEDAIRCVREELQRDPTIPIAAFIDDHARNAVIMLREARSERDAALAPPPAKALWEDIIGYAYTPTTWGKYAKYAAIHPVRIAEAMRIAMQRAPECADVIAMLIWWRALDAQTAAETQQEANKERDAALSRVAEMEALVNFDGLRQANEARHAQAIARAIRAERTRCAVIAMDPDPYWSASERCASLEARYIAKKILGEEPPEPDHALGEGDREVTTLSLRVLRDLADRCRAATGPSRELDARIWAELDGRDFEERPSASMHAALWIEAKSRSTPHDACLIGERLGDKFWPSGNRYPHVTGSLDAAMALVERMFPDAYWMFARARTRPTEPLYGFQLLNNHDIEEQIAIAEHSTREIAIVLCVLLALIERETAEGGK